MALALVQFRRPDYSGVRSSIQGRSPEPGGQVLDGRELARFVPLSAYGEMIDQPPTIGACRMAGLAVPAAD
jgi:hypothetical protein